MVSVLPTKISPWQAIGKSMSELGRNTPELLENRYQKGQLQESLGKIKDLASNPQGTNLDVLLSVLQAGAGIPGSERYMSQVLPEILKQVESNRAQRTPLAGESQQQGQIQPQQRNREPMEQPQQAQKLPDFGDNRFFPTNKGPGEGPGHIPQEATTGKKLPLLAPNEKPAAAKQLVADRKKEGIITTLPEAMAEINSFEDDKKVHNAAVDKELEQQVKGQKNYGQQAVEQLKKVYPNSTPEIDAVFKKFGEEEATKGKSESDIEKSLALKAKQFSNNISNIKQDLSAPRLLNSIGRKLQGTYKNFEESSKDLRAKLKPLLDMGLYDTARNLMSELGYYPEEIDVTVNPLGEREKTILNRVPKIKKTESKNPSFFSPEPVRDLESIKTGLKDLKEANPNFSLVLPRKVFEDLGYDSRMYKDALNELMQDGFELTDDQKQQLGILDTPPLNILEKILHDINIIGR